LLARPFSSFQERDGRRMVSLYLCNFAWFSRLREIDAADFDASA
jgi:hypothetical protein